MRTAPWSLCWRVATEQVGVGFVHLDELSEIIDAEARAGPSGGLTMAGISHVFTISRVAKMLGEDKIRCRRFAPKWTREDGRLTILGPGDEAITAFTPLSGHQFQGSSSSSFWTGCSAMPGQNVGEPGLRINVVHLGCDDQAVHDCGALAAAIGAAEQP